MSATLVMALVLGLVAPASANVGGGTGTTWGDNGEGLTGSGKFAFAGSGNNITVEFECDVTATPGISVDKVPLLVRVHFCEVRQGEVAKASAEPEAQAGAFHVVQDDGILSLSDGDPEICWDVSVVFRDNSELRLTDCGDGGILSR